MKETNIKNAKAAITITTILTLFVAGFEVVMAFTGSKPGMNFFDIASYATANQNVYCLILILANMILLPSAVLLYRQNGISLKTEIAERKTLGRDILLGLAALGATLLISLAYVPIFNAGKTELAFTNSDASVGIAKRFAGTILGETKALLLFNLMFAMLDWYNIGFSFFAGLVWIWAYKRSGHLISSIIAHGVGNLAAIIYFLVMNGVN